MLATHIIAPAVIDYSRQSTRERLYTMRCAMSAGIVNAPGLNFHAR